MNKFLLIVFLLLIAWNANSQDLPSVSEVVALEWSIDYKNQLYEISSRPLLTDKGVFISGNPEYYYDLSNGQKTGIKNYDSEKDFLVSSTRNEFVVFNLQRKSIHYKIRRERGPYLGHHSSKITSDTLMTVVSSPNRNYSIELHDIKNKMKLWDKNIDFPIISPPVISNDYVYCPTLNGVIVLQLLSGEIVRWINKGDKVLSSIKKQDESIYYITNESIVSYNTISAKINWTFSNSSLNGKNYDFVLNELYLLVITDGILYKISTKSGEEIWKKINYNFDQSNSIVASNNKVFCYISNPEIGVELGAIDIQTGDLTHLGFTSDEFPPDISHPTNLNKLDRQELFFFNGEVGNRLVAITFNNMFLFSLKSKE